MPTLGTALATYCGQNLGAGKYKRIYEGMRQGFFLCLAAALLAAAICIFGGRFIVSWFVSNPSEEIFTYAMQYLIVASWFFLPLAMIFLYRNALQGLNEGFMSDALRRGRAFVPLCRYCIDPESAGFLGVCFADPAAWVGASASAPHYLSALETEENEAISGSVAVPMSIGASRATLISVRKPPARACPRRRFSISMQLHCIYAFLIRSFYSSSSGIFLEQAIASAPWNECGTTRSMTADSSQSPCPEKLPRTSA